jgi:hypothetical protein
MSTRGYAVLLAALVSAEPDAEHAPAPWEANAHATSECLSWRGTLDNLRRRQAEDILGETIYVYFPLHTRTAVVMAHMLLEQGDIAEGELERRVGEVRARFHRA